MREFMDIGAWRQYLADLLTQLGATVTEMLPSLAAAVLILLVGWGVSKLIAMVVRQALHRLGLDRVADQLHITESLRRAQVTAAPSAIVARLAWWALMLSFLLAAVEVLGLRAVTATIGRVIVYLPNIAAAALIVVAGLLLGRFVRNLVQSAGAMAGLAQATQLGTVSHATVILVTAVLALEQLGVETDILVVVVTTLVATAGLSLGAAFALGARPLVSHILAGHTLRQLLPAGRLVEVGGRKGVVERVGSVDTLFRDGDRSWSMANAVLLEEVIVR